MKRILAFILATIMNISTLPMVGGAPATQANTANDEYVSLPITIRDYAADGMLFEWNDLGEKGDFTKEISSGTTTWKTVGSYAAITTTASGANGKSVHYCTPSLTAPNKWWYGWGLDSQGNVIGFSTSGAANSSATPSGVSHVVWAHDNCTVSGALAALKQITDANKGNYRITYSNGKITISQKTTTAAVVETYHHGNTRGYGLLYTDGSSHVNDMNIAGTQEVKNGEWGDTPDTLVSSKSTLNSGATQTLYGCYVRTDLVEGTLGADGKPVYTDATVTYLANYMQKTLPEVWKNSDGSYNMWYVMGTKLFDNNNNYVGKTSSATRDLAEVFRQSINGGLGSLDATRAKNITEAKDCRTYFDAAYFLLQSLYSDNTGYGQTVTEYHQINLVKKDGYYVYNSAYDGSIYDKTNGTISNSQTDTITTRAGTTYVRGNKQAETRFDPIGNNYYGYNSNKYVEILEPNGTDITHYYANTNYNMTLEGHAQFVFYEDEDLYFNFTGDDDVYLFINGKKILDMGGGHAIAKCGIKLNDVRELCGLKDGQVYDFDFYYMERHGTAANFGIETNIKIVDPSMLTEKLAYQDGVSVGNYGYVDPNKPVTYQFKLTNNGDAKIEDLTFNDAILDVSLTKDSIKLNSETTMSNLYAVVTDKDGTVIESYAAGKLTEAKLKAMLEKGLDVGDTISIAGIRYNIPENSWVNNQFTNTVNTTAISKGDNASHRTLNGLASCTVQKQEFHYDGLHYYDWKDHAVYADKADLVKAVTDVVGSISNTTIQLCSPSGRLDTDNNKYNEHATVTDKGITYVGTETGAENFYYKVGNYGPVAVTVYTYDVADNIYVLDYSLPVELNDAEHGLLVNDTLTLAENKNPTTATTRGIVEGSKTSNYGDFEYTSGSTTSLKYTLTKFMNGVDQVKISVMVMEDGAKELTNKTGVVMEETVSVVPANVVYYEDDFKGITYIDGNGNMWTQEGENDNMQSADQNSPYGSDPNYSEDTLVSDDSNGTVSSITVENTADVMSFEFRGTGFEILSRTTQNDYAIVSVKVERKNSDGTYTVVKQYPVITECKSGDLYQVPIISVTGLGLGDYKVTLRAVGKITPTSPTRVLYIDGIRIYNPLSSEEAKDYYNPDEVHAEFKEIKSLIGSGNAAYAAIVEGDDDEGLVLVTGATLIEGEAGDSLLVSTSDEDKETDLNQYMTLGPNNELYLDGISQNAFLAVYLKPVSGVAANARTIEVGAHRKVDALDSNGPAILAYGSTFEDIYNATNYYEVNSGTEQYYEIDPNTLTYDEANGRYILLIGANVEAEATVDYVALALTNLKISGYTLEPIELETQAAAEANAIETSPALMALKAMHEQYKSRTPQEPEEPQINEELVINSAGLKAKKVASGKSASLTVKCAGEAESLVILDANGDKVDLKKCTSNVKDGVTTFSVLWTVTGKRGETFDYTVVVYDSNGHRSSNTMPITVTIK